MLPGIVPKEHSKRLVLHNVTVFTASSLDMERIIFKL